MLLSWMSEKSLGCYRKARFAAQYGKAWHTSYLNDPECTGWPQLCLCFHATCTVWVSIVYRQMFSGIILHSKLCKWAGVLEEFSNFGAACKPQLLPSSCVFVALVSVLFLKCSQFLQCFWPFFSIPNFCGSLHFTPCLALCSAFYLLVLLYSVVFSVLW